MQNMNTQKQNGYMLLFRSDEWYEELSHDEIQKVISQNNAWIEGLIAQGKAKPGHALQRNGAMFPAQMDGSFRMGLSPNPKKSLVDSCYWMSKQLQKQLPLPKAAPLLRMALRLKFALWLKNVRSMFAHVNWRARSSSRLREF